MSDFNALLDQFRRLQAQVETQRPNLCSKHRKALHEASRNLFYACRSNGEESYPPPMQADAMIKCGVVPLEEWGSHPRHMMAVGGEVKADGPSDVVPVLLSPGYSHVPSGWLNDPQPILMDPTVVVINNLPDQKIGDCKPPFHPGFTVIGSLTGRTACGKIKDQSLPHQYMEKPIQGPSCEITKTPAYENLRRMNEGLPPLPPEGDKPVINNLFPFQKAIVEKCLEMEKGDRLIGRIGQSLGKSEHVLPGSFWLERQGEDRVHRKGGPLIVEIVAPSEDVILANLADKKRILQENMEKMRDDLDAKERQANVNAGKLSSESIKEIGQRIRRESRRHQDDAKAYAEMTLEMLGEPHEECDAPVIINQEKKDEGR